MVFALLLLLLLLLLLVLLRFVQLAAASRHLPPGPWGIPLLGYLPWLDARRPHASLARLAHRYGRIFGVQMGGVYAVVLSDAQLIRRVLAMDAAAGRAPLHLTHGVMEGYGLICAQGALWKDQRKFVSTFLRQIGACKFGAKREQMSGRIMRQVNAAISFLESQNGAAIDAADVFYHTIGSFMNELVFGTSYPRDDSFWLWIKHLQEEGIKHFGVAGPINFLSFLRFVPKYRKVFNFIMEGKRETHQIYRKIIAEEASHPEAARRDNLIQAFRREMALCSDCAHYSDRQFVHLLADIFGAGLHTTLTTICWYWLHMAADPEVQEVLHAEIDGVLQGRVGCLDDQAQLPHLMASIAEVQRLSTVVPLGIPHGTLDEISVDGMTIPKGSMIIPLQWAVHHDAKVWKEPNAFRLDHFLDSEGKFRKPDAFIPYQTGKRMCVGDELAKMLLFLFVVNVLQKFTISAENEVKFEGLNSITYSPVSQKLIFKPRF